MSTTVEVIADAIKEAGTTFIAGHPGGSTASPTPCSIARP